MGAVVSCITAVFRTIGNAIMAVITGVGSILKAIIDAIVSCVGIVVNFLTCGSCGGRRSKGGATRSHV